jgi:DNA-binding NtrC family response regulator
MTVPPATVLLVEDDPDFFDLERILLEDAGYRVRGAATVAAALESLERGRPAVAVLDLVLPDGSGQDVFSQLVARWPDVPVIFLSGSGSPDVALDVLQHGACAFLDKSSAIARLVEEVDEALAKAANEPALRHPAFRSILTQSRPMVEALRAAAAALTSSVPVLLQGESGTGKELFARALHDGASGRKGAFIAVNCASVADGLLEAELFGHERGAFTGAVSQKAGRFELAQGGTLFLDEIAEMDPRLQAKLLRVLQTGEYQRVGGTETLISDARIISATHRDLDREIEQGRFRADLFYRLAVYTVRLPPLRDRPGDIPLLTEAFIAKSAQREGRDIRSIDPVALQTLCAYAFPGNVRQLENVVTHAVVSGRREVLTLVDLPQRFLDSVRAQQRTSPAPSARPPAVVPAEFPTLAEVERVHIRAAMARADGNKAEAARLLGVSRMTLYRKLREESAPVGGTTGSGTAG